MKCYKTIQNPDFLRFAQECNRVRDYFGWSQEDVAGRAGVSRASVAHLESGKRTGTADTVLRVCKVLNINPMSVLWGAGPVTVSKAQLVVEDEE